MDAYFRDHVIVYADDEFAEYNRKNAVLCMEKLGGDCRILPDTEPETAREILIGKTNRKESVRLYGGADAPALMCYTVRCEGEKLLIAGHDYFSTRMAVEAVATALNDGKTPEACCVSGYSLLKAFPERRGSYRAMQYNILVEYIGWGAKGLLDAPVQTRSEQVMGIILGYQPDVLCLCEVFERWSMVLPRYLGRVYGFVCLNREDGYSNRTVLLYRKEKFDLLENGYVDISVVKTINKRVMVWALLKDRRNGRKVLATGTHWEVTSDEDRVQEAVQMAGLIRELRARFGNVETVSMGDYNAKPAAPSYQTFVRESGLKDVDGESGCEWAIDHIFTTPGIGKVATGREMAQYAEYASDHKAVWCDFELTSGDAE